MKRYLLLTLFALGISVLVFGQTTTDSKKEKAKVEQTTKAENVKADAETLKTADTPQSTKKASSCCKKSSASSCKGKSEATAKACCDKKGTTEQGKACCSKMAEKMKAEEKKEAPKKG